MSAYHSAVGSALTRSLFVMFLSNRYDKHTVSARMTLEGIGVGEITDGDKEGLKIRLHKAIKEEVGTEFGAEFTVQHISDLRVIPVDGQEAATLSFLAEVPIVDAAAIHSIENERELLRVKIDKAFEGAQGGGKLPFALGYVTSRSQLVGGPTRSPSHALL